MQNFQRKKGFKYFLQSKPVLIVLTIILIIFIWNTFVLVGKMQETSKNKKIEENKITDLENRKEKLIEDIEKLNTDKGKEEIIRENFGMVEEGEQVIVIVEDEKLNEIEEKGEEGGIRGFLRKLFN